MKDRYLEQLRRELENRKIDDCLISEIINDYSRRIELGLDTGLDIETIISRFETPSAVANNYCKTKNNIKNKSIFFEAKGSYKLNMRMANEDLEFRYHEKNSIIIDIIGEFETDEYKIVDEVNCIDIKRKNIFSKSIRCITVTLPESVEMESIRLSMISGNIKATVLRAKEIDVNTSLGSFWCEQLIGDTSRIKTFNGHIVVKQVLCSSSIFKAFSGDLIVVDDCQGDIKCSVVTGKANFANCEQLNKIDLLKKRIQSIKKDKR